MQLTWLGLQFLVTGSSDGLIELWDASSGSQRRDLAYQADGAFLMHPCSVLSLAVSRDSELLASGGSDGAIKVWRVLTGACVRRYDAAHSRGVSSLCFSRDASHLLSASLDGTVRVHGLKSGRMLRELRGHEGFVYAAVYGADGEQILTGGADGTLRVWDARSGEALRVSRPPIASAEAQPVLSLLPLPRGAQEERLLVCTRSARLHVITLSGAVVQTFSAEQAGVAESPFVAAACSPHGHFFYGLTHSGALLCFNAATGKLEHTQAAHEAGAATGLCHHPRKNVVASFASSDHCLRLFRAI